MTIKKGLSVSAGLAILAALVAGVQESRGQAAVPPPPITINPIQSGVLQRLGITQSFQKVRDANVNRRGNHPEREAKPPLKAIADPANLQSPDPSVKAAALIKQDQDLAPQKIKAIKYLATQCCCCDKYKGTPADPKLALMASLDDCTEQVRYAAAQALCECAGDPCEVCHRCGCCDPQIMNKLNKMANQQDDKGCYSEPSARVRGMAAAALQACRNVTAPTVVTPTPIPRETEPLRKAPGVKEVPTEAAPRTSPLPAPPNRSTESSTYVPTAEAPATLLQPVVYAVAPDPTEAPASSPARSLNATFVGDSRTVPSGTR